MMQEDCVGSLLIHAARRCVCMLHLCNDLVARRQQPACVCRHSNLQNQSPKSVGTSDSL